MVLLVYQKVMETLHETVLYHTKRTNVLQISGRQRWAKNVNKAWCRKNSRNTDFEGPQSILGTTHLAMSQLILLWWGCSWLVLAPSTICWQSSGFFKRKHLSKRDGPPTLHPLPESQKRHPLEPQILALENEALLPCFSPHHCGPKAQSPSLAQSLANRLSSIFGRWKNGWPMLTIPHSPNSYPNIGKPKNIKNHLRKITHQKICLQSTFFTLQ